MAKSIMDGVGKQAPEQGPVPSPALAFKYLYVMSPGHSELPEPTLQPLRGEADRNQYRGVGIIRRVNE